MKKKDYPMRNIMMVVFATLLAAPLQAQTSPQMATDLTVTMDRQQYRICNDRPARPAWMDEVHPREAYRAVTLMELYELRAWEQIVATGACECELRFPSWDASAAQYEQHYRNLSSAEHSALRREWIVRRRQIEPAVRSVCEAQGNW